MAASVRVVMENPDHDSLFLKFEQLELLLDAQDEYKSQRLRDALAVVRLIRAMVLK